MGRRCQRAQHQIVPQAHEVLHHTPNCSTTVLHRLFMHCEGRACSKERASARGGWAEGKRQGMSANLAMCLHLQLVPQSPPAQDESIPDDIFDVKHEAQVITKDVQQPGCYSLPLRHLDGSCPKFCKRF